MLYEKDSQGYLGSNWASSPYGGCVDWANIVNRVLPTLGGSLQWDTAREELDRNVQEVFQCAAQWQRHLKRQEVLHSDDMALANRCHLWVWESYWHRMELWEMFKDVM